jgi:hypothetical protein
VAGRGGARLVVRARAVRRSEETDGAAQRACVAETAVVDEQRHAYVSHHLPATPGRGHRPGWLHRRCAGGIETMRPGTPTTVEVLVLGGGHAGQAMSEHLTLDPILALNLHDAGVRSVIWATGFVSDCSWLQLDSFDDKGEGTIGGCLVSAGGVLARSAMTVAHRHQRRHLAYEPLAGNAPT